MLFPDLPFPPDFYEPVVAAVGTQQVLVVHPDFPVYTVDDLIEVSRRDPGSVSVASPGYGTSGQLGVLYLQELTGVEFTPVVYNTASQALPDVVAGHEARVTCCLQSVPVGRRKYPL